MNVESLAKLLHEAGREAVEKGKTVMRKPCTICNGTGTDSAHNMKCERCKGSGFEPFLSWEEISEDAREGRRIQARFLNAKLIEPVEDQLSAACATCNKGFTEDSECEVDGCPVGKAWDAFGYKSEEDEP